MLGAVPMSLDEITLAPAILGAKVINKGHKFKYFDLNLLLYDLCNRNKEKYFKLSNDIVNFNFQFNDPVIKKWTSKISSIVHESDIIMINVFSYLSHFSSLYYIDISRKVNPNAKILVGGIGSSKKFHNITNKDVKNFLDQKFYNMNSDVFGQILIDNNYITDWQKTTGSDVLDLHIEDLNPSLKNNVFDMENINKKKEFEFSVYNIDDYEWEHEKSLPLLSSYGCVRKCSFCDVLVHFPKYEFVDNDILTEDIVNIIDETGISKFIFMDSLINGGLKIFEQLLNKLIQKKNEKRIPTNFSWSSTYICRPQSTQLDRIHKLLKPSGADLMTIGVETGSDKIRYEMDKKFKNKDLLYELDAFSNEGVKAGLLFFPSWPTETIEDFNETLTLFKNLSKYAHNNTVDYINLGNNGFALLDGTPIDNNKDSIGLEPGPLPFLWHCKKNPDLNYWEALRRRILASETAMYYGIPLGREINNRMDIINSLEANKELIFEYVGALTFDPTSVGDYLDTLDKKYNVSLNVINSGEYDVELMINNGEKNINFLCSPGITPIIFCFQKTFSQPLQIKIKVKFNEKNDIQWSKFENNEYYNKNGLYLDNIMVNNKDITLSGFDQITEQKFNNPDLLPNDFFKNINKRCVVINSTLVWNIPEHTSFYSHLIKTLDSFYAKELKNTYNRLKSAFSKFYSN